MTSLWRVECKVFGSKFECVWMKNEDDNNGVQVGCLWMLDRLEGKRLVKG